MNCLQFNNYLWDYFNIDSSSALRSELIKHSSECSQCARILKLAMLEEEQLASRIGIPDLSENFTANVMTLVMSKHAESNNSVFSIWSKRLRKATGVAAPLVVVLTLILIFNWQGIFPKRAKSSSGVALNYATTPMQRDSNNANEQQIASGNINGNNTAAENMKAGALSSPPSSTLSVNSLSMPSNKINDDPQTTTETADSKTTDIGSNNAEALQFEPYGIEPSRKMEINNLMISPVMTDIPFPASVPDKYIVKNVVSSENGLVVDYQIKGSDQEFTLTIRKSQPSSSAIQNSENSAESSLSLHDSQEANSTKQELPMARKMSTESADVSSTSSNTENDDPASISWLIDNQNGKYQVSISGDVPPEVLREIAQELNLEP